MSLHRLHVSVSFKPPRGAWSWRIVRPGGPFVDGVGTEAYATAYRLRLQAVVAGLESLEDGAAVEVVTTDATTIRLAQDWIPAWVAIDFRKKGIESVDLVRRLAAELDRLTVTWLHQPRRTGDPHAKDCKLHATQAAERMEVPAEPPSRGEATVRGDVEVVAWTDGGSRTNPGPSGWTPAHRSRTKSTR